MRNNILPVHILRLYVWNLLKENEALSLVSGKDGTSLIPIVPVNDEPDFRDQNSPYIIYGFMEQEPAISVHHRGTVSFRVVSPTFADLSEIISVIASAFEVEDQAAANVNLWSSYTANNNVFLGVRFTSCCVTYIEAGDAQDHEGGPMEGIINIRYNYVADKPVKTFHSDGTWS